MSKEQLEHCYQQMYQGMIDKDRELLFEVLDEHFVLYHMSGMQQSREAFIRSIEEGTLNYFSVIHQNIEVENYGNQAQLIGQSLVNAAVFGGGRYTWRLQLKIKLVRKDHTWKMLEATASTY